MELGYYLKFSLTSLGIIGILLLMLRYAKKIQINRSNHNTIRIIDRVSIGSQAHIVVVEIDAKRYVLGASNSAIHVIDTL
jgi:flagellar biogenesis protein FliO